MIFIDRNHAGQLLGKKLLEEYSFSPERTTVLSLLRGGAVVGQRAASILHSLHLPLPVAKVKHPREREMAIGALCFGKLHLERPIIEYFNLSEETVKSQVRKAQALFETRLNAFGIRETDYAALKGKYAILVDDGIATSSSMKAAVSWVRTLDPAQITVATPVAPFDFKMEKGIATVILERVPELRAISRFYRNFQPVDEREAVRIFQPTK